PKRSRGRSGQRSPATKPCGPAPGWQGPLAIAGSAVTTSVRPPLGGRDRSLDADPGGTGGGSRSTSGSSAQEVASEPPPTRVVTAPDDGSPEPSSLAPFADLPRLPRSPSTLDASRPISLSNASTKGRFMR